MCELIFTYQFVGVMMSHTPYYINYWSYYITAPAFVPGELMLRE
jgi:hypothetical protein